MSSTAATVEPNVDHDAEFRSKSKLKSAWTAKKVRAVPTHNVQNVGNEQPSPMKTTSLSDHRLEPDTSPMNEVSLRDRHARIQFP